MEVIKIDKKTAQEWVSKKHYRRTLGIFWEGFALVEEGYITGVVCYGQPSAPIQKYSFVERNFRLYELTRLVIQSHNKNACSFLVSKSLKMLKEKPSAVISYADSAIGHCGIVYQATNWIYTGAVTAHDKMYLVDGKYLHPTTIRDRFKVTKISKWAKDNSIQSVKPKPKYRYFYILGNKKQKKNILSKLKYGIINTYPKCEKKMYDDGELIKQKVDVDCNESQLEFDFMRDL
jgi:hypothetical protein